MPSLIIKRVAVVRKRRPGRVWDAADQRMETPAQMKGEGEMPGKEYGPKGHYRGSPAKAAHERMLQHTQSADRNAMQSAIDQVNEGLAALAESYPAAADLQKKFDEMVMRWMSGPKTGEQGMPGEEGPAEPSPDMGPEGTEPVGSTALQSAGDGVKSLARTFSDLTA